MAKLTLLQPNFGRPDTSYNRSDSRIETSGGGWYLLDQDEGVVFGGVFGQSITYNSYTSPNLGTVSAFSSFLPSGETYWTLSGVAIAANNTDYVESALAYGNPYSCYVTRYLGGDDLIVGSAGDDRFSYTAGRDTIDGGAGSDSIDFSDIYGVTVDLGNNRYTVTDNYVQVVSSIRNVENIVGSSYDDALTGSAANNSLVGGRGDDTIIGAAGNDTLSGGDGADHLSGGLGDDLLLDSGGYSANVFDGGAGTDTVNYASSGVSLAVDLDFGTATRVYSSYSRYTDTLVNLENVIGSAWDDSLAGNAADNILAGGHGNDRLDGRAGSDTADYTNAYRAVTASLVSGLATGQGTDRLTSIENLSGSSYDDTLTGNAVNNVLKGNGGNDLLFGGAGDDVLDGGAGVDTASYTAVTGDGGVSINLNLSTKQNTVAAGGDTLIGIENLLGSDRGDQFTGNAGANSLDGRAGNDRLSGEAGNDQIIGGAGQDTLIGGSGNDAFIFRIVTESPASKPDTISDFTRGADKINLAAIDANIFAPGTQRFTFIASSANFTAAGQLKFVGGQLTGEVTGDAIADFALTLTNVTKLDASDFILTA